MISQIRWDWVIREVEGLVRIAMFEELTELEVEELELVINTLKNNTPFRVVPDCCFGNNNQQVSKPNCDTGNSNNVVLETKNFSVLGDKE